MFHIIWYLVIGRLCRAYLKIGDAHAHDSLLDSRAGSHRIGPRRRHILI